MVTRKILAQSLCIAIGCTMEDAYKGVDAIFTRMKWALTLPGDNSVNLPGIGTLKSVISQPRIGRDFKTGEPLKIYESKTLKFTISKSLKDEYKEQMKPYLEQEYPNDF